MPKETKEQFEARTKWWREAKFGMFIHWGLYAVPADATNLKGEKVIAEWYLSNKQMQVTEYEKFAPQFNPVQFNARDWVRMAKQAGMKYIVITSKHHDGFCLFDSKLTDYTITKASPFKRDPIKELATECKRHGIRFCFYHSIMDWHHPDYLPRRPWDTRPTTGADLNRYIDYMKGQLRELLTNYGSIGVLWFDGGWEHNAQELRSEEVVAMIRSLQPDIIINDRIQLPEDHSTPEQYIPARALPQGRLWETCMTMNDTWGYAKNDDNWKSTADLVRKLIDIAHKGGNFLLNVGPTAEGEFPPETIERLHEIGEWMKVNGTSIYGTTQSPFLRLPFNGRCTAKGSRLYLHLFERPAGALQLQGLQTKVRAARALNTNEKLEFRQTGSGDEATLTLSLPARFDPLATVIELQLAGKPNVLSIPLIRHADAQGVFHLQAADAEMHGVSLQYETGGGKDNIGFWTRQEDYVTWMLHLPAAGRYQAEINFACPPENAGTTYTLGVENGERLNGTVRATGSWTAFQTEPLGELNLPAGRVVFSVRIRNIPRGAAMNLKSITLLPVK